MCQEPQGYTVNPLQAWGSVPLEEYALGEVMGHLGFHEEGHSPAVGLSPARVEMSALVSPVVMPPFLWVPAWSLLSLEE